LGYFLISFLGTLSCGAQEWESVAALRRAWDAVVSIRGEKTVMDSPSSAGKADFARRVNGMGTGVVIDARGYIVTNYHVIDGVQQIQVTLADGKQFIARRVARDSKTDLALIKIDADGPLQTIALGTSAGLMPGEPVLALGNAFGYQHTATRGIISALHRSVQVNESQLYDDLIQTDASINPGNSGGPLLNMKGEMIGVNVAVRAGAQGIGFAIPVDKVVAVVNQLLAKVDDERIWHGVSVAAEPVRETRGSRVDTVEPNSPAAQAGIRPGDLIIQVGDQCVTRPLDFHRALLEREPKERITMLIERDGETLKIELELAQADRRRKDSPATWQLLGMELEPITPEQFRRQFPHTKYRGGLLVTAVRPEGPAAAQGIRPGDILVGLHIWETVSLSNVDYVLRRPDLATISPLKVYILRGSDTYYGFLMVGSSVRTAAHP